MNQKDDRIAQSSFLGPKATVYFLPVLFFSLVGSACAGVGHAVSVPGLYTESSEMEFDGAAMRDSPEMGPDGFADGLMGFGIRGTGSGGGGMGMMALPKMVGHEMTKASVSAATKTTQRQKIYTGHVTVLVPSLEDAKGQLLTHIESNGAHVASQNNSLYQVRVPAAHFSEFLESVKGLGRVMEERVDVEDVTRQVYELELRMSNARRARERLLTLLERAEQTKDLLEIEKELRRVTEEIELMEGNLRNLKDRISYSTLDVELRTNAPAASVRQRQYSPHQWIRATGPEAVWNMSTEAGVHLPWEGTPLELPPNYLLLDADAESMRAISSDESRLLVRRHLVAGGDDDFWQQALLQDLEENRGLVFDREVKLEAGPWRQIRIYDATVQGQPVKYLVGVSYRSSLLGGNRVVQLELVSRRKDFSEHLEALEKSLSKSG
jgi:hypothetical protein